MAYKNTSSIMTTRVSVGRIYAGLAIAFAFALAVLYACSSGGSGNPASSSPGPNNPTPDTTGTPPSSTNTLANPNALWLAEDAAAVKLDLVGALLRSEAVITSLTHITGDSETGTVWALGGSTLYSFRPTQAQTSATISLPDPTHTAHIAALPRSGALWIARGATLSLVDNAGSAGKTISLTAVSKDLVADGLNSLIWAATETGVTAYDGVTGAEKNSLPLPQGAGPQHIAFDASLDALWVATADTLALYASDGSARLAPLNIAQPGITHLASDNKGGVWLANVSQIVYLNSSGAQQFSLNLSTLFTSGSPLVGLAANLSDRSVWATTTTQLVKIRADGSAGITASLAGHINALAVFADAHAPKLTISAPGQGAYLNTARPPITATIDEVGSGLDVTTAKLLLDGVATAATCELKITDLVCTPDTALSDGGFKIKLSTHDFAGNTGESADVFFTVDTAVPQITVDNPINGSLTNAATISLIGRLSESASLTLNTQALAVNTSNAFTSSLTLAEGINTYTLSATDLAGNHSEQVLQITRDTVAPAAAPGGHLTVSAISGGSVTVTGAKESAEAGAKVSVTNTRTNTTVVATVAADGSFSVVIAVQNGDVLKVVVSDGANNSSPATSITAGTVLVPDPGTVAPPVDRTVASDIAATTAFLYTGSNPIQTGVTAGIIEAKRVAILRGKATLRDGSALASVRVSVLDHPELGQTLTRADGMFDLAVNGGGQLTVRYEKDGFLAVQRNVVAPWRDYAWLPDVVMIGLDSAVTSINLAASTSIQVARGNPVSDADGARQATILFPPGTTATMVMPNGTTQALTTLNVRATEYTVGDSGPKAMPAPLPPSSGYTYAAEFSVDEAIAAGATEVRFSQALPVYVENFIGFPVGGAVPTGYYDRQKGQWIASANGRVIKVLSITNGMADLDITGSGIAADAAALIALGVTGEERTHLATLYIPGQTLWRVPMTHFTPWDCNWPYGSPEDAIPPWWERIWEWLKNLWPADGSCKVGGSIIGCEDQTLGESVGINGTPWRLHYQSERTPGRKLANTIDVQISNGRPLPASLRAMRVEVSVAGRLYTKTFTPTQNLSYTMEWDGLDGYGRPLQGTQPASVQVHYDYVPQYYAVPRDFANSFARAEAAGVAISRSRAANTISLTRTRTEPVTAPDARAHGLGGWSIGIHHKYDPGTHTVLFGDGRERRTDAMSSNIINTIAGRGNNGFGCCFSGDGGLATAATFYNPTDVAVAADGTMYIADRNNNRIRRVGTDGIITTFAGGGGTANGDGGPATAGQVYGPAGVALAPDGSLFIAEYGDHRIRRVGLDGIITTVAGTGVLGFSGDGGPATAANISAPVHLALGPDGSLFFSEGVTHVSGCCYYGNRVRRVGPDGIITTVAGAGSASAGAFGFSGDGGPATAAKLYYPIGLAVGRDGTLYIADSNNRVRRIGPDGIITTVAGTGGAGFSGDGGLATAATLVPQYVAVGLDGDLYISDVGNHRIRRVGVDGYINTVAGTPGTLGRSGYCRDNGGPAPLSQLNPAGITLGPDGTLFVAEVSNNCVRAVTPAIPGTSVSDALVPSEDGSELYIFNSNGRHLRTMDAVTGLLQYQFGYSADGYLTSITDVNGNVTTVDRTGAMPTAIVAPGGQRTALNVGADGWLLSVTNPANESHTLSYSTDGLLQTFTDPRGNIHTFTYDALGRLVKDADPVGGSTSLAHTVQANGYTVTTTSALGRTHSYQVEQLSTGAQRRTVTSASGTATVRLINTDGTELITYADGSTASVTKSPDPRFGMLAPVTSVITKTLGGLTRTVTNTRTVALADPNNILSVTKLTNSLSDNGVVSASVYNDTGSTRTLTSTSGTGRSSTLTLDALGRVTQSKTLGLDPVSYAYDSRGLVTTITEGSGAASRTTTLAYNAAFELTGVTDALGRTLGLAYDSAGRLVTQTLPDARTVKFAYDAAGNTTAITPPGRTAHAFDYTEIDQAASYTPPDLGSGSTATQYSYNTDRALTRQTRPDGQLIDVGYDVAGRISSLGIARGTLGYSYDATTSKLTDITAPGGLDLSYTYDSDLIKGVTWSGAVAGSTAYIYNNELRVTAETVNAANSVSYGYDVDGLLKTAGSLALTYNAQNGLRTGSTLGSVTDSLTYNTLAELTNYSASYTSTGLYSTTYTYDALGRITQKVETIGGTTATYGYGYDAAGRLSAVTKDSVPFSSYSYDSNGNRTARTGPSVSASVDAQDRLTSYGSTTYSYTANGELLTKTTGALTTSYQFDALGNLLKVTLPDGTVIDYLIDGTNRRVGKKVNGTLVQGFLYQGSLRPVAELDSSNTVVSRFVYATHINVPDYLIKGGVTYRIITDQLGSPRLVVDVATGTVSQRIDYDEFGQVLSDTNPGFQPFGFAGGLYDRDTKLVRFGARDYNAETGRWTAKDPIGFGGGDGNLYAYVGGDPVNYTDPNGLNPLLVMLAVWNAYDTLSDIVDTACTLLDPNASASDMLSAVGRLGLGVINPLPKNIAKSADGVVYKRANPLTGEKYVGQAKSPSRFDARQGEHDRALGVQHEYEILGRAQPGKQLDVLEESMIRQNGGIQKRGGVLVNKRHQMSEPRYRAAGGDVDSPY